MMPHALQTDSRRLLEQWASQHFRNEVLDTILHNDPRTLPEATIQRIEQDVLAEAQDLVSTLPIDQLKNPRYMNIMIGDAISETKDRLRKAAAPAAWRTHQDSRMEEWRNRGRRTRKETAR